MFEVVVLTAVPELTQDEFDALIPFISSERQERIKRFHSFRDAWNCLLADVLTRTEICCATGCRNNQLKFSTNTYGKPFLASHPNVHYNISHAGHYIACVLYDQPVGIDIELIKPIDLKIAERFFAPDETAYVVSCRDDLIAQRFFEVWTMKESRIKWEGKGLSKPLPSFSVFDSVERNGVFYHRVFNDGEAICHVCSAEWKLPTVRVIDILTLLGRVRTITDDYPHTPYP